MKDFIVTTMPIKPRIHTSIGMSVAPMLVDFIGKKLDIKNVLAINLLHAYECKDSISNQYIRDLNKMGFSFEQTFVDKDFLDVLCESIILLYKKNLVQKMKKSIVRCKCGKVDIVKEGIRNYENGDLYYWKNNKLYCRECHSECKEYQESQLYLYLNPSISDRIHITPYFLQSEISHFHKTMPGKCILVSKNRKTECSLNIHNESYYIDHDLLWMCYVQCFRESNQILVASNHQLYEMYLLNYINQMAFSKKLNFIATPYMKGNQQRTKELLSQYEDLLYQKLCMLYSLKWRNKDCQFDESIFKGIAKLGGINRKMLYDMIIESPICEIENIEEYLNSLFLKEINMQNNIRVIRTKNVTLRK